MLKDSFHLCVAQAFFCAKMHSEVFSLPIYIFLSIVFVPLIGTLLGGLLLLWKRNSFSKNGEQFLNHAAGGIMFAAAVWSLLIPAVENSFFFPVWFPVITGFLSGGILIALLEKFLSNNDKKGGSMLMLAVTIHNFPEGMAVGVALAGFAAGNSALSCVALLSLGIAIQNIPEGAIIYAPMRKCGRSRRISLLYTFLSGIVEPVGALLAFFLTAIFQPLMPFILSFAAGAMIFVVADEMMPEGKSNRTSSLPALIFMCSFSLMMLLDIALG